MDKLKEAILILADISPPLSIESIAKRVRCTGAHVEQVLQVAGLGRREMLSTPQAVELPPRETAVLRVAADLADRGLRVYAPLNPGTATGPKVDLVALKGLQGGMVGFVVAVATFDAFGEFHRSSPRLGPMVVRATVMAEGVAYEPTLSKAFATPGER
jgi:hypothetical protein